MSNTNDPKLTPIAQRLRKNMTKEEARLWYGFLRKLPFRVNRQKVIGKYIVDFYCASKKTAIELDGDYHYHCAMSERDCARDKELEQKCGIRTLRFENKVVFENPNGIVSQILKIAGESTPSPLRGTPPM